MSSEPAETPTLLHLAGRLSSVAFALENFNPDFVVDDFLFDPKRPAETWHLDAKKSNVKKSDAALGLLNGLTEGIAEANTLALRFSHSYSLAQEALAVLLQVNEYLAEAYAGTQASKRDNEVVTHVAEGFRKGRERCVPELERIAASLRAAWMSERQRPATLGGEQGKREIVATASGLPARASFLRQEFLRAAEAPPDVRHFILWPKIGWGSVEPLDPFTFTSEVLWARVYGIAAGSHPVRERGPLYCDGLTLRGQFVQGAYYDFRGLNCPDEKVWEATEPIEDAIAAFESLACEAVASFGEVSGLHPVHRETELGKKWLSTLYETLKPPDEEFQGGDGAIWCVQRLPYDVFRSSALAIELLFPTTRTKTDAAIGGQGEAARTRSGKERTVYRRTTEELFKAALRKHHNYDEPESEFNYEPITPRGVETLMGNAISDTTAQRLFAAHFGSVKAYKLACRNDSIRAKLTALMGDVLKTIDPTLLEKTLPGDDDDPDE